MVSKIDNIGNIIRERRLSLKITQKELSKKVGKSQQLICDIEAGRKNPSINTLFKIAKVLNLSLDKFFLQ